MHKDIAPFLIGIQGDAIVGIIGAVVDQEIFAHRQETQAHTAVAFRNVKVHDHIRTDGADFVHDLFHIDAHPECVGVGPLLRRVGGIPVNGPLSSIKMDDTEFKFAVNNVDGFGLMSDYDFGSIKGKLNLYRKAVSLP